MSHFAKADQFTVFDEIQQILPSYYNQALKDSLEENGQLEPIIVWHSKKQFIVIDGHNRLELLKELNKEIMYVIRDFKNVTHAKQVALEAQLQRRNLNRESRQYAIGKLYRQEKLGHGGARIAKGRDDHLNTRETIAKKYNVSSKTVARAAIWSEAVDIIQNWYGIVVRDKVLSGNPPISSKQAAQLVHQSVSLQGEHENLQSLLAALQPPEDREKGKLEEVLKQVLKLNKKELNGLMNQLINPREGELDLNELNSVYESPTEEQVRQWYSNNHLQIRSCFRIIPLRSNPQYYLDTKKFKRWCKTHDIPLTGHERT